MAATHKFPFTGSDLCFRGTEIQTVCSMHGKISYFCLIYTNNLSSASLLSIHQNHKHIMLVYKPTLITVFTSPFKMIHQHLPFYFPNISFSFNIYLFSVIIAAWQRSWIPALCCQLSFLHHLNKPLSVRACVLCFIVTKAALESKYNMYPLH